MSEPEDRPQPRSETPDEEWWEKASFAGVCITQEHEDGILVSGIAAETLPKDLRIRCLDVLARYRAATGHEPAWLFIDCAEEKIVVRSS